MLRKIILHGPLRKLHPSGVIELDARNVHEALSGMSHQLQLKPNLWCGRPTYSVLGCDTLDSIMSEENSQQELHVVPAFLGSGGNTFKIVIGAILVVVGIATGNIQLAIAGAGLLIGGLINLLFPTKQENTGPSQNHYLQAAGNTTAIGTRIPLLFGTYQAYGHILSYNVDSTDLVGGQGDGARVGPDGAGSTDNSDRIVYT